MGQFEQWGDKANDIEQERARNNRSHRNNRSAYKYNKQHYTSRKKSSGFLNSVFKAMALVFIIWVIASILK